LTSSGKFLFVALALIWGIPYLLIKVAMGELTPASLVFLRTALGAVLLLPFVLGRGNLRALVARWRPLLLYTVAELAIPWVLLSDVERRVDSSLAGLMVASVPLVGALLSRLSGGRDRLSGLEVGGLALGFTGVVILLGFNLGAGDPWAILEMLLVVVGYAVGPMVIARRLSDLPVLEVVAASLVICVVAYAPLGIHQLPVHRRGLRRLLQAHRGGGSDSGDGGDLSESRRGRPRGRTAPGRTLYCYHGPGLRAHPCRSLVHHRAGEAWHRTPPGARAGDRAARAGLRRVSLKTLPPR